MQGLQSAQARDPRRLIFAQQQGCPRRRKFPPMSWTSLSAGRISGPTLEERCDQCPLRLFGREPREGARPIGVQDGLSNLRPLALPQLRRALIAVAQAVSMGLIELFKIYLQRHPHIAALARALLLSVHGQRRDPPERNHRHHQSEYLWPFLRTSGGVCVRGLMEEQQDLP